MGTNFYAVKATKPPCECCGRAYEIERRHIGKSSAGWCFSLHVIPEDGINTLNDWRREWSAEGVTIEDEYGAAWTPADMLERIANRCWPAAKPHSPQFYEQNGAQPGPDGLLRHRIGSHCIGHGEGTWDYIVGEFS